MLLLSCCNHSSDSVDLIIDLVIVLLYYIDLYVEDIMIALLIDWLIE